jgi:branched-chain amino acid transport system substrate-binding protein
VSGVSKSRSIGFKQLFSVVIGLGMVGCSSIVPVSGGAAQQGVDNKVITIGMASIMSGPSASASAISEAAKVYLDMLNRNGGVNGYTFKYIQRDFANQPAQAVAVSQQFLNEDKVFAEIIEGTPGMQAVAPISSTLKLPILAASDGDLVRALSNVFGFSPRYSVMPLFEAQFLIKTLNIKDIAYFYSDDASGRPALPNLPDFVSANGGTLATTVGWATDTTDWAPFAQKLKDSGAHGVMFYGGTSQLAGLQKAADAIGYRPTYVSAYGNLAPTYVKLAGPLAEGVYIDSHMEPVDATTPEAEKFNSELKAAGKDSIVGTLAGTGWTMGAVIEEGVRRATANGAALTWDSFTNALNSFKSQKAGMYPSLTYTTQDHTGVTQASEYQVQNGKFVQALPMTDIPQPVGK